MKKNTDFRIKRALIFIFIIGGKSLDYPLSLTFLILPKKFMEGLSMIIYKALSIKHGA